MMRINKPMPPILTNKYPKEVIKLYYRFIEKANGSHIGMAFYLTQINDPQLKKVDYMVHPLLLPLNKSQVCLETINDIMLTQNFVRWL